MAEKACHGFASTTQVGLTQALGASNLKLERFTASATSGGHSTPAVARFGRPDSDMSPLAHSGIAAVRSPTSVAACGAWTGRESVVSGRGWPVRVDSVGRGIIQKTTQI